MKVGDLVKTTRGYIVIVLHEHIIEGKLKYVDVMYDNGYISIGDQLLHFSEVISESR